MATVNTVYLFLVIIFNSLVISEFSELVSVAILYRHGHRTPRTFYKNDPYKNQVSKLWPEGYGELTNIGKMETFTLGKWFRKKYKTFLPIKYNKKFIRVLSSNKDRCLMSAACVLAGLFPPKDEQIWNNHIKWLPIPIHTVPENLDGIIATDEILCKKYLKIYKELIHSKEFDKFIKSKKDIFDYLTLHTGENVTYHYDVTAIHDTLFIENLYNLTLPDWTKKVFPNVTLHLLNLNSEVDTNTTQLARLKSGLLVDYITTFFEDYLRDPDTSQKMLMLSGHDSTIARLMNVLGVYDYTWAEYASTLVFELRRKKKQVFIKIYFKDSKNLRKIKLPQCPMECNFEAFKNITKPIRINDDEWVKECASE